MYHGRSMEEVIYHWATLSGRHRLHSQILSSGDVRFDPPLDDCLKNPCHQGTTVMCTEINTSGAFGLAGFTACRGAFVTKSIGVSNPVAASNSTLTQSVIQLAHSRTFRTACLCPV